MPNRPYLGRTVDDTIAMYKPHVSGTEGAVSSNSPYATQAGLEIMKQGGNAFDAAVAVSLVLGVVEPYHCGIGGGCFHTFYDKNTNEFYCVDARGIAPKNAYQDMMLDENGDVDLNLTEYSGRSVSVPSFYRAMDNLLKKHGTMTWEQVSAPAIKLCRDGFACGFAYARITDTPEAEHNKAEYEGFEELYLNHGKPRQFGEIIKNIINAVYLGRDGSGFHISLKDSMSLNMDADGEVLIKGAQGITGTPQAATFTIGVILVLITLFIVMNLVNSRTGRAIMAIRDNRIAAESIGINITKYKLMAFSISAGLAGVAGVLYAHNLTTLTALPKNFGYNMSIMILVYVVLGGIGSIRGSVIATVILYLLPEMLRGLSNYRMLMYAIVLILAMLFNSAPQFVVIRERMFAALKGNKKPAKEAK